MTLRLRNDLTEIAARRGANIKLVEMPPGPPVISTITVEIYGQAAVGFLVEAPTAYSDEPVHVAGAGVVPEEVAGDQAALDRP